MFNYFRRPAGSFAAMSLYGKLDMLSEGTWLLIVFLLPVYFNPLCYSAFYFVKALALVFLVSLLLGMVLARWLLRSPTAGMGGLPAKIQKSPLQLAALILGLVWVVSTFFSVMPGKSLWGNLGECVGFLPNAAWIVFFLVVSQQIKDRPQVLRVLYTLLLSSGVVSLLGILSVFVPGILPGHQVNGRIFSTEGNPLSLSAFLAMAMPVTLALVILNWYGWGSQPRSKKKFVALLIVFGLQLCCLALAQYSITMLLYVIGMFVFFALVGIFLQRRATLTLSILSILLVAISAAVLLGQLVLTGKEGLPGEGKTTSAPIAEQVGLPTLGIRVQIWKCAADVMIDSPEVPFTYDALHGLRRLIGYGPETFIATSQLRFPAALKSSYTYNLVGLPEPDNHYLYLGVTLGILGLLAFLALLAVYFWMVFRLLARSKDRQTIVLASAFAASIAQYCAHIFFNPSYVVPEMVFWTLLGVTAALAKMGAYGVSAGCPSASTTGCPEGAALKSGKSRRFMSVLVILIFIAAGSGLTLPLLSANMKVRDGFNMWYKEPGLALASFRDATLVGPGQANYQDILGSFAFINATQSGADPDKKGVGLELSRLAGNAAIQLEPQLAFWRYRHADRLMYGIIGAVAEEKANVLRLYEESARLFPGNAVILNKWALALMLTGNYGEAAQKLLESGESDPSWVQTSYYKGLLSMHEGSIKQAGGLFVAPVANNLGNLSYFLNFCRQVTPYGEIGLVRSALIPYVVERDDDWTGFALLGIADIYGGIPAEALANFKKASAVIPDNHTELLATVMRTLLSPDPDFRNESEEVIRALMERKVKSRSNSY